MSIKLLKKAFQPLAKTNSNSGPPLLIWLERMKIVIKLSVIAILSFSCALAISLWWFWDTPLASPVSSLTIFRFLAEPRSPRTTNKVIYGFLPYWNLKKVTIQPELTELAYFSLTIGADGSLITRENDYTEPGYAGLQSDELLDLTNMVQANNSSVELVVSQFNGDDIVSFLSSKPAQAKFMQSLDAAILSYPVNGVNIDIEYAGTNSESLRDNLSEFMKDLRTHLNSRYDSVQLSIDMYAGASTNESIWDIEGIAPHVDYIVVMAYDFHRRSSAQAGPVAPLFGGKELWDSDINQHLQEFLTMVPAEKILLGIPFYGYEWQTTSRDPQSHTFPDTGSTAQISRVKELLEKKDELQVQEGWNEEALSPYLSYIENGETYVLYYENSRSISYKLDYVNQLDLGGIAIWALGYEGDSRELWDVINRKIQ